MRCTSVTKAVVLVGTSLLSLNATAWRVDLDFNDGAVGSRAQGSGGFSDAAGQSYYTTAQSYEGGKAVELNVTAGDTAFGNWGGIINHPSNLVKGDEIWFRVRTFMPAGFNYNSNGEGGHLKFLRVHTLPAGSPDGNQGYDDWYINPAGSSISHKFIFEGEQVWNQSASSAYAPVLGVWETYEMYLYLDNVPVSAGGKGRVRMWKNGVLMKDITDRKTLSSATSQSDRSHLFTYWNGGAPKTQKMYVDDIVLTSDVPAGRDAQGNPFVGAGVAAAPPDPPVVTVQ